jgi:hypothetical protein
MKRTTSIARFITRVLGLFMVCWVLGGLTGCEQIPGNTAAQAGPEEKTGKEEEKQGENPAPPAKLTGIFIGSPPETLFYALGQSFESAGLIVYGDYDDDTGRELETGEYTLGRVDTSRSGAQMVRVSAGDYTASFPIMVNNSDSALNSISVSAPAGGLVRYLGQVLGTEGFTVTGHFTEGDRVLSAFSVGGYDRVKRGAQTITLSVNGKTAYLPVTVKVPANATVTPWVLGTDEAEPRMGHNNVFIRGQALSLSNVRFWARVTCNNVTVNLVSGKGITLDDIGGFDPNRAGKQQITLNLDEKTPALDVYVADKAPELYFDYGFMRTADDPGGWGSGSGRTEGCYHTQPGATLVLSPVRALIGYDRDNRDLGVSWSWTVTPRGESPALAPSPANGEFLSLTPTGGGTWDVSVTVTGRNFVDGSTISKTAQTAVICDTGPLPGTDPNLGGYQLKNFAPGQFTESGTGAGWSLGAFGGYAILSWPSHYDRYYLMGNAFPVEGTAHGWVEPGVVWFQEDQNGNNLPDEMWYELNVGGDPSITRRYSLTYYKYGDDVAMNEYGQTLREVYWVDGKGRTGQINGGWPWKWGVSNEDGAWATYTGTLLWDDGFIKSPGYAGYWPNCVDTGQEWFYVNEAVAADGSPVNLTKVRFIKVHTAVFKYGGLFGEQSTELELLH